jgi:hypothetical protein
MYKSRTIREQIYSQSERQPLNVPDSRCDSRGEFESIPTYDDCSGFLQHLKDGHEYKAMH